MTYDHFLKLNPTIMEKQSNQDNRAFAGQDATANNTFDKNNYGEDVTLQRDTDGRSLDLDMSDRTNLMDDQPLHGGTGTSFGSDQNANRYDVNSSTGDDLNRAGQGSAYTGATGTLKDESYRDTQPLGTDRSASNEGSSVMTVMFQDPDDAEKAYRKLKDHGYQEDEISVVMSKDTRKRHYGDDDKAHSEDLGNKSLEGAGAGSAIGGTVGAIVGAIAAIGTSIVLPGLGLVIAGPLAAGLAGAGAGGLAGGIIGALAGAGVPKEQAELYERGIKEGGILLSFRPHGRADAEMFEREFRNFRGEHIHY